MPVSREKRRSRMEMMAPKVVDLRRKGYTYGQISKTLGVSISFAHRAGEAVSLGVYGDHQDRNIVNALYEHGVLPPQEVVKYVALGLTTIRVRLRDLKLRGLIEEVATPKDSKYGKRHIHYKALAPAPALPGEMSKRLQARPALEESRKITPAEGWFDALSTGVFNHAPAELKDQPEPHNCKTIWAGGNPYARMAQSASPFPQ